MKVVSLFSGCGGFDLGFIQAGFDIIWANDFDKIACKTYRYNIGNIVCSDIRNIPSREIPNDCDVLIGGFPCQGFSVNNKKRTVNDQRNFLYREMLRVVADKRPKFVIAENVKGLLSIGEGIVLQKIIKDFSSLGYNVIYKVLNAKNYGIAQSRERIFIVASLNKDFQFPSGQNNLITVKDAIGHLADIRCQDESFTVGNRLIHNHIARENVSNIFYARKYDVNQKEICAFLRKHKNIPIKKIDHHFGYKHTAAHWFRSDQWGTLPNREQWIILKELLGFDGRYDEQMTTFIKQKITFEQMQRVVNWDKPSRTITASNPEIHPHLQRRLSVRECAILQSFPSNFIFQGSLTSMHRQIGNAVPPKMSFYMANEIKRLYLNI